MTAVANAAWGYTENTLYERKADARDELLRTFSMLQGALITQQFFLRVNFPQSNVSRCAFKLRPAILNIKLNSEISLQTVLYTELQIF
jgi:hypothetical protein